MHIKLSRIPLKQTGKLNPIARLQVINLLALELFFFILAHPVYKM